MELSHLDERGRARMVDVTPKPETRRVAIAAGFLRMSPATIELIERQAIAKGDVFTVAKVAGILAAKHTPSLIPMCHSLLLTEVTVDLEALADGVAIRASVTTVGRTGAEMEALTAVTVTGLTIYDMVKAVDKTMTMTDVRLIRKEGGRSSWDDSVVDAHGPESGSQ
jgi:cyclic pyranopterin phosphate synthase